MSDLLDMLKDLHVVELRDQRQKDRGGYQSPLLRTLHLYSMSLPELIELLANAAARNEYYVMQALNEGIPLTGYPHLCQALADALAERNLEERKSAMIEASPAG